MSDVDAFNSFVDGLDLQDLRISEIISRATGARQGWKMDVGRLRSRLLWQRVLVYTLAGFLGALVGVAIRKMVLRNI